MEASGQGSDWQFLQCFGERTPGEEIQEADIISTVEFDHDGMHLATGDRGGRVVLFERVNPNARGPGMDVRQTPPMPHGAAFECRYMTEFQSHEPEFDYLKSLEIEEKINQVRWCRSSSATRMLLSTNDKTVKLWKVYEKKVACLANFNVESRGPAGLGGPWTNSVSMPRLSKPLHVPTVTSTEILLAARCKKVYANAHTYHINSISVNSDGETFLSADDLRINMWNLEIAEQSFNLVDIKPSNMEDLTEVITSAEFHPTHCHTLAYSSSKGCIRLADMRAAALCDQHAKAYAEAESQANKSFFSEIIASISDISFSEDGRYILSRDYMTLKLWDINKENAPVATYNVHEQLRARLCDLYENDSIFDKFDCCINGSGTGIATGSYNNLFRVFNAWDGTDATLEASRDPMRKRLQAPPSRNRLAGRKGAAPQGTLPAGAAELGTDYMSKLLHLAWHPEANVIAVAASNSLYMYCA
mmetsp:Transcript_8111/g.24445  ORF Transcript_8111/g.24445 Transcript_8111/m.24445 type:complete len:474 (-) Transcript_8111:292-1713(-)